MKDTIVVTGGAGFIGSNLIAKLNTYGYNNIVLSDFLDDGKQVSNINNLRINDFVAPNKLCDFIGGNGVDKIFHLGACSDTTEWDGKLMMQRNFTFSKDLLESALKKKIPFVYASSAAVYGKNVCSSEILSNEKPLNIYGFSKWLFDNYVRSNLKRFNSLVCGVRFFNVYGPNENHKDKMASVIYHFNNQLITEGSIKVFGGSHGFSAGEHLRDFIEVNNAVDLTIWLSERDANHSGIYNCGTGTARSFNNVANLVIKWHKRGVIKYVEFPPKLLPFYQPHTCADLLKIISLGYNPQFKNLEEGVNDYLNWLNGD